MNDNNVSRSESSSRRVPWNKGKLPGAKPPLRPSHVWSIRTKLQLDRRTRDLALFNLAIDSKLRGCDVVAIRVDDVAPNGYTLDRASIRQRKTGRPVRFEITEQTRQAIDDYLKLTGRQPGQLLFAGRGGGETRGLTTRQDARLVGEWIASIGLDRLKFGTHSLRRTKATLIYRRTGPVPDYVPSRYDPVCDACERVGGRDIVHDFERTRNAADERAALPNVVYRMSSLRAGVFGKEDYYVQRADYQHTVRSTQLSTTGHSPARDIIHPMSSGT